MTYRYTIVLEHENAKFSRELNINDFNSAEKTFTVLLKGLEGEVGNFTLTLTGNSEPDKKILLNFIKNY